MNFFSNEMIDVLTALLTPTIAILGVYIAIQQYRLANEKHRIEIYDRRMKIYAVTLELLRNANRRGNISKDGYYKFEEGIAEAEFLFGKEVIALLDDISDVGYSILWAKTEEGYEETPIHLTDANLKHADLMNKFFLFENRVRQGFAPYLHLPLSRVRKTTAYRNRVADTISEKESVGEEDIPF